MLSTRQSQVAQLLVQGKISKEISYELGISLPTCTEHIKRLYEKLGVSNRAECVSRLIELGVQAPRQAPRCDTPKVFDGYRFGEKGR